MTDATGFLREATMFLAVGGVDPEDARYAMRVFIAVALVVVLGLLFTAKRLYVLHRNRFLAQLHASGWIGVLVGFALGPFGLGVVTDEALLQVRPVIVIALGWIGMLIGLQCRRDLLASIPSRLWRSAAFDAAFAAVLLAPLAAMTFLRPADVAGAGWWLLIGAFFFSTGAGWSPETRSLEGGKGAGIQRLANELRAVAGLMSILAVLVYGVAGAVTYRGPQTQLLVAPATGLTALVAVLALAVGGAVLGRFLLTRVGRNRAEQLLLLIGSIALVSGIAAELGVSPLFPTLILGAILANMNAPPIRDFERMIIAGEQSFGIIFSVLAGVLIVPRLDFWDWLTVLAIIAARLLYKPYAVRGLMPGVKTSLARTHPLVLAPVRQSLIAVAIGVSVVLRETSEFHRQLLTVTVLVGLTTTLIGMAFGRLIQREEDVALGAETSESAA